MKKRIPSCLYEYFRQIEDSYFLGLTSDCNLVCDECAVENECSILGYVLDMLKEKLELTNGRTL